jgi:SpoIID/LytB domain protein
MSVPRSRRANSEDLRVGEATPSGYRVVPLSLEDYVARAVAGEASADAPAAALEAQAIVARTFAIANRHRHGSEGFDVCDLTHCQVLREPGEAAQLAAHESAGRILIAAGRPARVWFSASCGGVTARPREIWPSVVDAADPPYVVSRAEPGCREATRWHAEIREPDLARAFRAAGYRGDLIRNLKVLAYTASGRVGRVRVEGFEPPEMSGEQFRLAVGRTLGWNLVRSPLFTVARTSGGYAFEGSGFGHGVGLCVLGASRLAAGGATADVILRTYFPGAAVGSWPVPGTPVPPIQLELPEADERERPLLVGMVERQMARLRQATGAELPATLTIRFHPTVESFRRSTGRPWWVAGAMRGHLIDLLPVAVLRARGTLESTLRHELAHALTEPALGDRPLWVREGVASVFAEGHAAGAAACPTDDEMLKVPTPEAMQSLYDRAAACVARELAVGVAWREVGIKRDL